MAKSNDNLFMDEPTVELPSVHTMLRRIATTPVRPGEEDALPIEVVDIEVGSWVDRGYRLVSTHLTGSDTNSFTMVYVLSK